MGGIGSGGDFFVGGFFGVVDFFEGMCGFDGGGIFFGAKVLRHGPEVQRGNESSGVVVVGVHPVVRRGNFLEKNEMMGW